MNVTSLESYLRLTLIECLNRFAKTRLWYFWKQTKQNGKTKRTQDGVDILDFLGTVLNHLLDGTKAKHMSIQRWGVKKHVRYFIFSRNIHLQNSIFFVILSISRTTIFVALSNLSKRNMFKTVCDKHNWHIISSIQNKILFSCYSLDCCFNVYHFISYNKV